jgi:hypothetical protein
MIPARAIPERVLQASSPGGNHPAACLVHEPGEHFTKHLC